MRPRPKIDVRLPMTPGIEATSLRLVARAR
jgi:hypothetical protein